MANEEEDAVRSEILKEFSVMDIWLGVDQFAKVRLNMTGLEFVRLVRSGESVAHLHEHAQEVADLVALLPPDEEE
jgi:hypothetical protein